MTLRTIQYALWGLVVIVLAAGLGLWIGYRVIGSQSPIAAMASIGGSFELTGADGEQVSSNEIFRKPSALFFGFTHCPDICPTTLFEAGGWLDALGAEADRINIVFVSVDPERDTPEMLRSYMSAFDPRIIGLTGSPEQVAEVVKQYRVYVRKVDLENGDYTVDHYAAVMLFNRQGEFRGTIDPREPEENAVAKLRRLAEET